MRQKAYQLLLGRLADDHLVNLEPVPIALVLRDITGRPGHVDGQRPGVLHGGVVPQLEAEAMAFATLVLPALAKEPELQRKSSLGLRNCLIGMMSLLFSRMYSQSLESLPLTSSLLKR
jgi:hypothetical protein